MSSNFKIFITLKFLFLIALASLQFSCTRESNKDPKIKLDLSAFTRSQKISPFAVGDQVVKVAINISGGPKFVNFGWEPCHCLPNGTVEEPPSQFIIPVDAGPNQLIQVMFVFENITGGSSFMYGDTLLNIQPGDNVANIVVNTLFASEASADAGIRFLRADGTSPTGKIEMLYQPPDNKPIMVIHEVFAFKGWMRIHLFENTRLTYRVVSTGEIIFNELNFSHPDFISSPKMLRVKYPLFYSDKNHDQAPPFEVESSGDFFIGFAGPGSTNKWACYDPTNNVLLTSAYVDGSGVTPLQWSGTTINTGHFHRVSGGESKLSANCTSAIPYLSKLTFNQDNLGKSGGDGLLGFKGVFQSQMGNYGPAEIISKYQEHLDVTQLNWKYLPGSFIGENSIVGVKIFHRYDPSHSENYRMNDEIMCNELTALGFQWTADVLGSTSESYVFSNPFPGTTYIHDYQIILCPMAASGELFGNLATVAHDLGSGPLQFGNGSDGDITISANIPSPNTDTSVLSGKILMANRMVNGISSDGKSLTLNSAFTASAFDIGDEVLWHVVMSSGPTGCGVDLPPGLYGFGRITSTMPGSSTITLDAPITSPTGTIANSNFTNPILSPSLFCRIIVQRVPNFKNLNMDATGGSFSITTSLLNINSGGSGILAFRVLESLTFNTSANAITFNASGKGYLGGTFTSNQTSGQGFLGEILNNSNGIGNSGASADGFGGAGGAGGGNGGNGGDNTSIMSGKTAEYLGCTNCYPEHYIFFGGGGGSGTSSYPGGNGGGAILVSASNISGGTTITFQAKGNNGSSTSTTLAAGGGGGGGFISIQSKFNSSNLNVYVDGGLGGAATANYGGGGGGGGRIYTHHCTGSGSYNKSLLGATFGAGGNGLTGSTGADMSPTQGTMAYCY